MALETLLHLFFSLTPFFNRHEKIVPTPGVFWSNANLFLKLYTPETKYLWRQVPI